MDSDRCPLPGWHVSGPDSAIAGTKKHRLPDGRGSVSGCKRRTPILNRDREGVGACAHFFTASDGRGSAPLPNRERERPVLVSEVGALVSTNILPGITRLFPNK
jgi:hypothetical protein